MNKQEKKEWTKKWKETNPDYYKKWREEHPGYHKEYMEKWHKDNPGYWKKATEKHRSKNPEKEIARSKLRHAVRTGKIKKPFVCSDCKKKKMVGGHHEDYSKPLDVMWLCASCHKKLHLNIAG